MGVRGNSISVAAVLRQCPFCGVPVSRTIAQCPSCREVIGAAEGPSMGPSKRMALPQKRRFVRRGLLYMLLAGVSYYVSAGYSALSLPVFITSAVTAIFVPLLFLGGLGLTLFGLWRG